MTRRIDRSALLRREPRNRRGRVLASVTVLFTALALTGCSVEPTYKRPSVDVPAHYLESGTSSAGAWQAAHPADDQPRGPWWTLFGDSTLNSLEARVDVSNQTLRKSVAALDVARSVYDRERAGFLPTVTAGASQSRTRVSQNLLYRNATDGRTFPDHAVGLTASWEPDVFGKIRSQTDAAQASMQASASDVETVRLAMTAELAADYLDLRANDREKALLDQTIAAYQQVYDMMQQRFKLGVSGAGDLATAKAQLEATQTQDTDLDVMRAQLQHAIATLIGVPASNFVLPVQTTQQAIPDVPAGVPSALLERRPDIAAAERRVAAANAEIGMARAAFYPDLNLAVTVGLESSLLSPWMTASSLFWSLGPSIVGTVFDGGQHEANLRGANAQYDMAVADYRQTVLTAFQQVEDGLSAARVLSQEAQSQQSAVDASGQALDLAMNRFKGGAISYLDVVNLQTMALTDRRMAVDIEKRRMDADVQLLEALGGGWKPAS